MVSFQLGYKNFINPQDLDPETGLPVRFDVELVSGNHKRLKVLINPVNAIFLICDKEAAAHLWSRCTRIEQSWCCVYKHTRRKCFVCFQNTINIVSMNTNSNAHSGKKIFPEGRL